MASLVPDLRKFIVGLEVMNAASVSEATWRKIAGMINFIGHRTHQEKMFVLNGKYGEFQGLYPINFVDGLSVFEYDAEIFNVWIYNSIPGSSGITELDLKVKPKLSGAFTSIFSTTPKIGTSAPSDVFFEVGDVMTGITAPIFNGSSPYLVNKGDAIRLDIITAMVDAEHCGIVLHFRPR
jgi:hypothetical protein